MKLSERDIETKFITPAIEAAGWDIHSQVFQEHSFTDGRIIVRGNLTARGKRKRADYILFCKPNIPIAIIEAKDGSHCIGDGIQQGLEYAEILDIPFVFSSNGQGFLFHDRTKTEGEITVELRMDEFPTPETLWQRYIGAKAIDGEAERIITQPYREDDGGKTPRYYQTVAINRVVEAIAKGDNRLLLVMATGVGKTLTAFQIIWRLWKAGRKKRILFLADRNILVDQTMVNDFQPFGGAMAKLSSRAKTIEKSNGEIVDLPLAISKKRRVDTAFEIYLGLYQALTGPDEKDKVYKDFSPDFFDLIVIDECHRGSADKDSAWREILEYFDSATQLGMTATPKETKEVSNIDYFGEPVYTYSLKQGIEDGFLAPYKVLRYDLDKDLLSYRPEKGKIDKYGHEVEDRIYNQRDFDRKLVLDQRTTLVAKKITEYLKATNRLDKAIVFCEDQEHAARMRQAIANENADQVSKNHRYVMRITGEDTRGKEQLENFIDPESTYPVIATTSKLLSTGVDAKTCKLIVLDQRIQSMTEFKQIIGRGTRIEEDYDKQFFTIMDFKRATELFADPDFDGDPVQIFEPGPDDPVIPPDDEDIGGNDDVGGEEDDWPNDPEEEDDPTGPLPPPPPRPAGPKKFYLDDVRVQVLAKRLQYLDADGKLMTDSLSLLTEKAMKASYKTLDDFIRRWSEEDRKQVLVAELEEQGIIIEGLREEVNGSENMGVFDLLCHVAYGQPPLTRAERAKNVKKRNYFSKYEDRARAVLEALLDKYADEGLEPIENGQVLQLKPISDMGTKLEIINGIFGGASKYKAAIKELQNEIFRGA